METRIVRYTRETMPKQTEADREAFKRLAALPDSEIDFSDAPEMTEERYQAAKAAGQVFVGRFYRPIKKHVSARLDADVLDWLKKEGRGYQSRMNAILRREMLASLQASLQASPQPGAKAETRSRRAKAVSAR